MHGQGHESGADYLKTTSWKVQSVFALEGAPFVLNESIADQQTYCEHIDGLRGIAILMVMAVHSGILAQQLQHSSFRFQASANLLDSGARGVQLFFILSAFTLFHSSLRRFRIDAKPKTSFYIRRAFRILPFWWLAVLFYGVVTHAQLRNAFPSLFFYFGFIRFDATREIVPGGWSLFVEETFYLFLPFILAYVTSLGRAFRFFLGTLFIGVLWFKFAARIGVPSENSFIALSPLTNWFCFALGIIAYYIFKEKRPLRLLPDDAAPHWLDAGLVVLVLALVVNRFAAPFALFALTLAAENPSRPIGRIMRNKWLKRYGQYCYSLYLSHFALLLAIPPSIRLPQVAFHPSSHGSHVPGRLFGASGGRPGHRLRLLQLYREALRGPRKEADPRHQPPGDRGVRLGHPEGRLTGICGVTARRHPARDPRLASPGSAPGSCRPGHSPRCGRARC